MCSCIRQPGFYTFSLLGLLHEVRKYMFLTRIFWPEHQSFPRECCSVHSNIRSAGLEFLLTHKAVAYGFGSNNAEHIATLSYFLEDRTVRMLLLAGKREYIREEQYQVDILYPTQHYSRHLPQRWLLFFAWKWTLSLIDSFLHAFLTPKTRKLWKRAMASTPWPWLDCCWRFWNAHMTNRDINWK